MKAFLMGFVFIIVVGAGTYVYLKYFYRAPVAADSRTYKLAIVTKTGLLLQTNLEGSDFTHVLIIPTGNSLGVASYSLNLDDYVGKQVSVTGQYSGDTLYADQIEVLE